MKNLRNIPWDDAVARVVRYAHNRILTGEATIRNFNTVDTILKDAKQVWLPPSERLRRGYGRRCKNIEGGTYGKKYIVEYKDDVKE